MKSSIFLKNNAQDNAINVVYNIMKLLKKKITRNEIDLISKSHPNYPSLFTISKVLEYFGLKNICIDASTLPLSKIPTPFIAHLLQPENVFSIVEEVNQDWVIRRDVGNKKIIEPISKFLKIWYGVALILDLENFQHPQHSPLEKLRFFLTNNIQDIARTGLIVSLQILLIALVFANPWMGYTLLIIKIFGILVSAILLYDQLNPQRKIASKACKVISKKSNCDDLLKSNSARFLGLIGWAELGFLYFVGSAGAILSIKQAYTSNPIIQLLSLLTVGFSIWSLYHQAFKVKQWCPLCLLVLGVFVVEFVTIVLPFRPLQALASFDTLFVFTSFAIPFFLWLLLKPYIEKAFAHDAVWSKLAAIKRNSALLKAALQNETALVSLPEDVAIPEFGATSAKHEAVLVTNPWCGACETAFKEINQIIHDGASLNVKVIFCVGESEEQAVFNQAVQMMAYYLIGTSIQQIFADYYQLSKAQFDQKYPLELDETIIDQAKTSIKQHGLWCKAAQIQFTPTYYLNGFQKPSIYEWKDLRFHLMGE